MIANEPIRVAVTGVGGGGGQAIAKALYAGLTPVEVFPVDVTPLSAGLYQTRNQGTVLPKPEDDIGAWGDWIEANRIRAILPGSDHDLLPLARVNQAWWKAYGCSVIVAYEDAVRVSNDKALTHQLLAECDVATPVSSWGGDKPDDLLLNMGWPIVVKPRFGMTSRGLNIAHDAEELAFYWKRTVNPIAQEYIEGDEYTCALTFDKWQELGATFVMKRWLYAGTTYRAEAGDFSEITAFLHEFARKTRRMKWVGAINVQLRVHPERGPVVLEINARCSGSTAIRAHFGYNEPEMLVKHWVLKEPIFQPRFTRKGFAFRYWDETYLRDVGEAELLQSAETEVLP